MGAATSSNYASQAQMATSAMNTSIAQQSKNNQSNQNSVQQVCEDIRIVVGKEGGGSTINFCNQQFTQGITMKQLNETMQKANINNESYQELQQRMSQAAKSLVKGFNFGAYSDASNVVKQSMTVATTISNDVDQKCNANTSGINAALQKCKKVTIKVDGKDTDVRACNQQGEQQAVMEQISKCQQQAAVTNKTVQSLTQKAKQVATASSIGLDPLALLLIGAIVVLVVVVLGGGKMIGALTKPSTMLTIAGVGTLVAGSVLIVTALMMRSKPGYGIDQFLTTVYPGNQFPTGLTDVQIRKLKQTCTDNKSSKSCLTKGNICKYDYEAGCVVRDGLVGYPYNKLQTDNLTPSGVYDECKKDSKCSAWRWDADKVGSHGMVVSKEMPPNVSGIFVSDKDDLNQVDRKACRAKPQTCQNACKSGEIPDIRDACGITPDQKIVTDKETCDKQKNIKTSDGCNIPSCDWNTNTNTCQNPRSGCTNDAIVKKDLSFNGCSDWTCSAYNCLTCNQNLPSGTGYLYTLNKKGLPSIEPAKWNPNVSQQYSTAPGASQTTPTAQENAAMRCATYPSFGAVRLPPSGCVIENGKQNCKDFDVIQSKTGNQIQFGIGIGLAAIGAGLVVAGILSSRTTTATNSKEPAEGIELGNLTKKVNKE